MAQVGMIKSCFFFAATCSNPHHHHPHSVFPNKSSLVFSSASSTPFPSFKKLSSSSITHFYGRRLLLGDTQTLFPKTRTSSTNAQMGIRIGKSQRWWEKDLQPNMKEVPGAQDLVNSLLNAGDDLVVVDFFSPGCAGCKALHPKICQIAGMNPHVQFLQVNYEEHKSMCYSLNVHVLPFFRFYRGAHGRVCSFSCTNATIKKFKDALVKYGADCCSLGPAKGLEEKELLALAANRDLSFNYTPKSEPPVAVPSKEEILTEAAAASPPPNLGPPLPLPRPLSSIAQSVGSQNTQKNSLVSSGR